MVQTGGPTVVLSPAVPPLPSPSFPVGVPRPGSCNRATPGRSRPPPAQLAPANSTTSSTFPKLSLAGCYLSEVCTLKMLTDFLMFVNKEQTRLWISDIVPKYGLFRGYSRTILLNYSLFYLDQFTNLWIGCPYVYIHLWLCTNLCLRL